MNILALGFLLFPTGNFEGIEARDDPPEYFMAVFAFEGRPNVPRRAHTFAVFVKKHADKTEIQTISWLPRTLNVAPLRPAPEPGVNLELHETIKLGLSQGARIWQWGPYQVKAELYEKAERQVERLNAGAVLYKAVDDLFRPGRAINCIHAVSDLVDGNLLATGTAFGVPASRMVFNHLRRWISDGQIRPDINKILDLEKYQFVQEK